MIDAIKDLLSILALVCGGIFALGGAWTLVRRGLADLEEHKRNLKGLDERHAILASELRGRCCELEAASARLQAQVERDYAVSTVILNSITKDTP